MRQVSVPFKLSAVMALVACALLVALGLACGSAYGDSRSDDNEAGSTSSLMAGSIADSPQLVAASKSAVYNVGSGSHTCDDPDTEYTIVGTSTNGSTVTIKGGSAQNPIRVTLENVTIDQGSVKPSSSPITVESGHAIIKLRGANVLKAGHKRVTLWHDWGFAGLCVQKGATCVITSAEGDGSTSGSLEAHGGHDQYGGAGIGTSYDDDTGSIYISGGTIRAYGAPSAAGIGSGRDGECYTTCIQGGDVWAWGGEYAAGIGGGDAVGASTGGTTHDLWIRGGTVHAYGGNNGGAGIGGSEGGSVDKITITGGNITAYGCGENGSKGSAAGIGSGDGEVCGTIKIDQGSGELAINATGHGEGAGIGGANCKSGAIDIKLDGGTITATGGPEAAGIGSGDDESGAINIRGNGTINAHAGWQSAAIGAGDQGHSGPININGNNARLSINAYAPESQNPGENFVSYAAIIGAGDGSASDITINNANINLNGSGIGTIDGAGIGTGTSNDLSMKDGGIGNITISNAQIRFHGIHMMSGAGIGAGYGSNVKTITLDNVDYDGPTIGSSCSDRFATDENSVESISISNSNIKAIARGDNKYNHAGIGTGPYGTIESISIANSNVEAKGVHGGAGIGSGGIYVNPSQVLHLASSDGKCGSVTISGRGTVKATGSEGGAGIGGGTLTSVYKDITISNGATVEAVGGDDSGAGIGGGKLCSCADISIDGATVTATGGPAAPGIGSGGVSEASVVSGAIQSTWNTICGNISISGKSNVTATGGDGAAGIGLGQGAQMESSSGITISGGTVNAQGGARGAGIGAGRESGFGRGAEARRIRIEGEAKVTATGGAGAAGIGGGYEGGVEQCHIALSVNDPNRAFVIARGGVGAAGIGAGASSRQSTSKGTLDGAHDAKSLSFGGGFVAAYGGDGSENSEEGRTGPGAGIGGGSFQGDLEGCLISGGVVVAQGGAKATSGPTTNYVAAEDIGHGGSREGGGDGSDSIYIQGGTVVGSVNENNRVLVSGGSVVHRFAFDKATKSNFGLEPVYQNAIAIDTKPTAPYEFAGREFYSLGLESTSAEYFKCKDVFAIADGENPNRAKAYLYLPAGEQDATTAYIKPIDAALGYYGTTTANQYPDYATGTNVLKMGAPIAIAPKRRSAGLIEGQPYIVRVGDLSGALTSSDTASYTWIENGTFSGYYAADGQLVADLSHVPIYTTYSTGTTYTDVEVKPGAAGSTMRIKAKLNGASEASDLYWGDGEALFEKVIEAAPPYVEITNKDELTKVYDGKPVVKPRVETNGTVTSAKCIGQLGTTYDKTADSVDDLTMPTDVGYYEVTVWAQLDGRTVTDSASFQISEPPERQNPTVEIVEDLTKYYDGEPVKNPAVKVVEGDADVTERAEVAYSYMPGSSNPVEPGVYLVTATATVDGMTASDTRLFLIRKLPEPLPYVKITNADKLSKVYDGDPVVDVAYDTNADVVGITYIGQQATTAGGTQPYGPTPEKPAQIGNYSVTVNVELSGQEASDTATFAISENTDQKKKPYLVVDDPSKVYDTQVVDPVVWCMSDGVLSLTYRTQGGEALSGAPKDAGAYILTVSVAETERYEGAVYEREFTIARKDGVLALAASVGENEGEAVISIALSGVYRDVVGGTIDVTLGETTVEAAVEESEGGFTASCSFDSVAPGTHEVQAGVKAGFANDNYQVAAATTTFVMPAQDPDVQVKIVGDLDKVYDGEAVGEPEVEATPGAEVTYAYSSGSAPKEPGVYLVTATATLDGATASDTRLFLIRKCSILLAVDASDKVRDGQPAVVTTTVKAGNGKPVDQAQAIELTYYEELDDGALGAKLDSAPVDVGSYRVVATTPGSSHYRAAEASAAFSILDKPVPFLFVDMPERLVYDAQPVNRPRVVDDAQTVAYPVVSTSSDGVAAITYYDAAGVALRDAPTNAGTYSVEVSIPETSSYCAVSSERISFTILPHPAVLSIAAIGNQSQESAAVVVTISGALADIVDKFVDIGVTFDDPDAMSAQSAGDAQLTAQAATAVQAQIENTGGSLSATHEFAHVGAGAYEVTASYSNNPNYAVKDATAHFDKRMRGYRIAAEDKTVTFGDAPFAVQAEVWDSNGSPVADPDLTYAQVSSEDLPMVSEDAAVLGGGGIVSVQNAGISAIRVDAAGNDTHEGNFDYAVITVEKAPLPLSVTAEDKVADGKPAEVAYFVDDAAYPAPYSGNVELTYFRESAGVRTQLDAAPIEDGSYVVVATAAGDRNYNAAVAEASFEIRASSDPDIPDNPDNPDKPDTKPAPSNDSGGINGGTSTPRTGDNVVVWPLMVFAAFGLAALACSVRRMRMTGQRGGKGLTGWF